MPHGFHDGGEVVVEQNHVGRFLRYFRAVDAHGNADVGVFEGRSVVHAVAGHGHELVAGLQSADDAQLLGGVDAGVHPHALHQLLKRGLVELSQLLAGQHQVLGRGNNAQAFGYGLGRELVVAGNHHGRDAGGFALGHGLPGFGAGRVYQAGEADEAQAGFDGGGRHVGGHRGQQLGGVAQHPVALAGQLVHAPLQVGNIGLLAGIELLKQRAYGSFGEAQDSLVGLVQGTHALALRVEGQLGKTRKPGFEGCPAVPLFGGVPHQGHLRGVAHPLAFVVLRNVVVQGHGREQPVARNTDTTEDGQTEFWRFVDLLHRHFIEREGTRFVGADVGGRAQRFHGGQLADEGIALDQALGPQRQRDGNQRGQGLGQGGDGQRDRHQQQLAQRLAPQPAHREKHGPDDQCRRRQPLAQGGQPLLQGRHRFLGLNERGNLAQLGIHARAHYVGRGAPIGHESALEAHVQLVAQRVVAGGQRVRVFLHVGRFAGQRRLVDFQGVRLEEAQVGGNNVAGFEQHHVAGHQVGGGHFQRLAVA